MIKDTSIQALICEIMEHVEGWEYYYPPEERDGIVHDDTIRQIFNILDKVDNDVKLMYLILYCTGIRISSLLLLENNCVSKSEIKNRDGKLETNYFIQYYNQKCTRESMSIIPGNLYSLIRDKVKQNIEDGTNSKYLFHTKKGKNYTVGVASEMIKGELGKFKIWDEYHRQYEFHAHDYRRTFATRCHEHGVPIENISVLLDHSNIDTTSHYIRRTSQYWTKKMNDFYKKIEPPIEIEDDTVVDSSYFNKKGINYHDVNLGVCCRPIKLGYCSHDTDNNCPRCAMFHTLITELDNIKEEIMMNDLCLDFCKQNHYAMQYEERLEYKEALEMLLDKIENIKQNI